MKSERQEAIIELLRSQKIETQSDLASALQEKGFRVTQATVSRDIKEMRLVKVSSPGGGYQYALPGQEGKSVSERMIRMLRESLLYVDFAGNMVVVRTLSGSANSAAEALDSLEWPEILGSIAGDNTIFLVVRNEEFAAEISERILRLADHERRKG